jgi:plasmid stabilization system protein ParE
VKLELASEALEELSEAAEWYERSYPGRGDRFLTAAGEAIDRLRDAPLSYPSFLGTRARSVLVVHFPYRVVYVLRAKGVIRVLAFAHAKRRPGYWRARLRTR